MVRLSLNFGVLLTVLGLGAYFMTGSQSITALIPSFFGLAMLLSGFLSQRGILVKGNAYISFTLGVLGFLGSVSGIAQFISYMNGVQIARPQAAITQTAMAVICLIFIIMAVRMLFFKK